MLNGRDAEFQQRVIAATIPHDPGLEIAQKLFDPHGVEQTDQGAVFYPTSADEFRQMAEMFAQRD